MLQASPSQGARMGFVLDIDPALFRCWGSQKTYIAQLELVIVLATFLSCAQWLRDAPALIFVDNVPALMALVNGSSASASLDGMALFLHAACFALRSKPYFEYVESKANWADEISRLGLKGPWAARNGFRVGCCAFPAQLLALPFAAVIKLFQFL